MPPADKFEFTYGTVVRHNENEINDTGGRHFARVLIQARQIVFCGGTSRRTRCKSTSLGVVGAPLASSLRRHAFSVFLIRGASCKLPSVF